MMKPISILSIDLPWTDKNFTSATYIEFCTVQKKITHFTNFTKRLARRDEQFAAIIKESLRLDGKEIDYILLDMPIGGNTYTKHLKKKFRGVEYALTNFSNFSSPNSSRPICFPTFMAGAKTFKGHTNIICEEGLITAAKIMMELGCKKTKLMEIFPQTSIPAIVLQCEKPEILIDKLAPHKKTKGGDIWLRDELSKILKKNSSITIDLVKPLDEGGSINNGLEDLCDSVMGALPLLDCLSPTFLGKTAAWFLYNPTADYAQPISRTNKHQKTVIRNFWIDKANLDEIKPGYIQKGIFTYDYLWKEGIMPGLVKSGLK